MSYIKYGNQFITSGGKIMSGSVDSPQFSEWFLPSEEELNAMYTNLAGQSIGNFVGGTYWSSSEVSATDARTILFSGEGALPAEKTLTGEVRPARYFTAASGQYELGDPGPGGGLIFHIDDTTYYEAAENDIPLASTHTWSNITATAVGAAAEGTAIGTGLANTLAIVDQDGHTTSAAQKCLDYVV